MRVAAVQLQTGARPTGGRYSGYAGCIAHDGADVTSATLRGELRMDEPMARHTSWRVGGCVERSYLPADVDDLCAFLATLPESEPVYFVGLGSNLLVRDGKLRGTVIFMHGALAHIRFEGNVVHAEAGVPSPKVARFAAVHALAGAEFLAGIPGTVGGALAMNAGCYGGETWNIVESVTTVDREGRLRQRTRANYEIDYRKVSLTTDSSDAVLRTHPSSHIRHPSDEWFVAARFKLPRGDRGKARATIKQLLEKRIASQPLSQHNAGSVFRNPEGDYAARLIEACGLKGYALGGAAISIQHANFIVNTGRARAAEIEALITIAHDTVQQKFGIDLQREVRIVGEHS
jgi:UDP-N-acetylmuramate dehydrogenase